jgi:hypothetical protein
MEELLASYLKGEDIVISGGRVYSLSAGKRSADFISAGRLRICLAPCISLDELERNFLRHEPDIVGAEVDKQLASAAGSLDKGRLNEQRFSDPVEEKRAIAYRIMQMYDMSDVKNVVCTTRSAMMSAQELLPELKRRITAELDRGFMSSAMQGRRLLSLRGVIYELEECGAPNAAGYGVEIHINGRAYAPKNPPISLESIIGARDTVLASAVDSAVRRSGIIKDIGCMKAGSLQGIVRASEYYDPKRNVGFRTLRSKNKDEVYAYTRTPEYILWEDENDRYYHFPPAEVGVMILVDTVSGRRGTSYPPQVLNRYKHPANPEIGRPMQIICFSRFDHREVEGLDVYSRTAALLEHGCRMLMVNYCSEGGAYKNLNKPEISELFRDYLLTESDVDFSKVHNRDACLNRRRRMDGRS